MKNTVTILGAIIFASFMFAGCGQTSNKQKELELKERELALKEKELALKEKGVLKEDSMTKNVVQNPKDQPKNVKGITDPKPITNTPKDEFQINVNSISPIPNGYNVDCKFSKTKGGSPIFLTTLNAGGGGIMNLNDKVVKLRIIPGKSTSYNEGYIDYYEGEGWSIVVNEKTDEMSNKYGNITVKKDGQTVKLNFWGTCEIDRGE